LDVKKTILITGATGGIGKDAAFRLADRGYDVIATGRNESKLMALAKDVGGRAIRTMQLDVTDAASIRRAVEQTREITGGAGLFGLVNNAGYGMAGPVAEISDADMRAQFDVNVFGLMAVTRAFLPLFGEKGRIVNIGSVAGRITFPMFGIYHASKFAVRALSDAMRMELSPFDIKVVLVEPGPIETNFADRTVDEVSRYHNASSPYAPVFEDIDRLRAHTDAAAVGPEKVSHVIAHALEARWPAPRYVVPFSSRIATFLLEAMPERLRDFVMKRALGLTRGRLARPGAPRLSAA
jgi:short-subunit dehydrogenase